MKFKNYYEYTLSITDRLEKAFSDLKLPSNAFIHKGRCGIGGTWIALFYAGHTVITVPNKSIIASKLKEIDKYPYGIFPVQGGVTVEAIKAYLLTTLTTPGSYIKIMVIPDSFDKVMKAAALVSKEIESFNIKRDCFLLIDECHTAITEYYRGEFILKPFNFFWEFDNKSVISATPYVFSDPRFAAMDYHKINFIEPYIDKVDIIKAYSVTAALQKLLNSPDKFPGNIFIFLNSVTDSIDAIKRAGITQASMFYADKEENHEKLEGFRYFYQDEPLPDIYTKFNFFTCKYFEGWDLRDKNATLVFVTDIYSPHTRVRIPIKGIQAAGRLRIEPEDETTKPYKIIHITNTNNIKEMKTQSQLEADYLIQAEILINHYNECKGQNKAMIPEIATSAKRYADINNDIATINTNKVDQLINDSLTNEEYASIETIGELWKNGLYEPRYYLYEGKVEPSKRESKRISKADKLKADLEEFERLEHEKEIIAFNLAYDELDKLKESKPFAYQVYKELTKDEIAKLNYKEAAIKMALIEKSNLTAEQKLLRLLDNEFHLNDNITKPEIKQTLQRFYNAVGLKDKHGNIRVATAEQLADAGRFEIEESKTKVGNKSKPSFKIVRKQFGMKATA